MGGGDIAWVGHWLGTHFLFSTSSPNCTHVRVLLWWCGARESGCGVCYIGDSGCDVGES